jgi:hypothetical protein
MADNPYWDGKVYKQLRSGDRTVAGTAKDPQIYRRRRAERARLNAIAAAEIQEAKYARGSHGRFALSVASWNGRFAPSVASLNFSTR